MHPLTKDITGQTFGKLTVLRYVGSGGRGAKWECLCACGKTRVTLGCFLRSGGAVSCGCARNAWSSGKRQRLDLTGKVFHKLTAIRTDGHIGKLTAWICRCECGTEKRYRSNALHPICRLKSCGKCWNAEKKAKTAKRHAEERDNRAPVKHGRVPRFTMDADIVALDLSRQRKWQLQYNRLGLCAFCAAPKMDERGFCEKHQKSKKRTHDSACAKCGASGLGKTAAAQHCSTGRKRGRPCKAYSPLFAASLHALLPAYSV